jgi:hypothetical protein
MKCAHLQCSRPRTKNGLCRAHIFLMRDGKSIAWPIRCGAKGCKRDNGMIRGYCAGHARRIAKTGDPQESVPLGARKPARPCTVSGCGNVRVSRGLCKKHYTRQQRTGTVHLLPRDVSPVVHPSGRLTTREIDRELYRGASLDEIADQHLIHPRALRLWLDRVGRHDLLARCSGSAA